VLKSPKSPCSLVLYAVLLWRLARELVTFLGVIHILLWTVWHQPNGSLNTLHESVISQIPTTIETTLLRLGLHDHMTIHAVCPSCHYTYQPKQNYGLAIPYYPKSCTNKTRPYSEICDTTLLQELDTSNKPIKTYVHHHFFDSLARLLSGKDLETKFVISLSSHLANPHLNI
jgi:hypothetical protein